MKDWNVEWDMEQAEVDAMIASFEAMRDCKHDWIPATPDNADLGMDEECTKCGATSVTVTPQEFHQIADLLEEGKVDRE